MKAWRLIRSCDVELPLTTEVLQPSRRKCYNLSFTSVTNGGDYQQRCYNHQEGGVTTIIATTGDNLHAWHTGWTLTAMLSPRPSVRVATRDAHGNVLNQFTSQHHIDDAEPDRPWALYLADTGRRFRLLAFDFDAKTIDGAAAADLDAKTIAGFLTDVGLEHVLCKSGPSGGRHVWVALAESIEAESVATLARLLRHVCPTLDISPLTNAATGCVRPPGAPHRNGGHSEIISGDLQALTNPTGTASQVMKLIENIADLVNDEEPLGVMEPSVKLPVDHHGRFYIPGPRRPLPTKSAAALKIDAASGDASAVLWQIIIGAAAARWRYADMAALVATEPGLEHVRTYRNRNARHARSRHEAEQTLKRQWDKAVRFVATTKRQIGDDPTFDLRAGAISEIAHSLQTRANASAGRWSAAGGPTDRRVLNVLCLLALQAVSSTIEADIRRVAIIAGIGRETARTALKRLAKDGWIRQVQQSHGVRGAIWSIDPKKVIHTSIDTSRSQAVPRPLGAGTAERTILISKLTQQLTDGTHDLFTQKALGHLAGNCYSLLGSAPKTLSQLVAEGITEIHLQRALDKLISAGVIIQTSLGWKRHRTDCRTRAVKYFGVTGTLKARTKRYMLERQLWSWWQAEYEWMRAPKVLKKKTPVTVEQGSLFHLPGISHARGLHPRKLNGRLDWRAARRIIETDQENSPLVLQSA